MEPDLIRLGWTEARAAAFEPFAVEGLVPGRVFVAHNQLFRLYTAKGELLASLAGRVRHLAGSRAELPVSGDWVALRRDPNDGRGSIQAVLPRTSAFTRKVKGDLAEEQVLAANIDTVFLVMGLDADYSVRRIERYLARAHESGAQPIVLLTKTDLCEDVGARRREVERGAARVPVHALSPKRREGLEALFPYLTPGRTVALLGSSGVGKSTLINALLGEERQHTLETRKSDSTGRHATTLRELIPLPGGALIMDTPGLRELQLWESDSGLRDAFDDVETLAATCRFADCSHDREPGCAVREAASSGSLPAERLASFMKLRAEVRHVEARVDARARHEQKRQERVQHRLMRQRLKQKGYK